MDAGDSLNVLFSTVRVKRLDFHSTCGMNLCKYGRLRHRLDANTSIVCPFVLLVVIPGNDRGLWKWLYMYMYRVRGRAPLQNGMFAPACRLPGPQEAIEGFAAGSF